MSTELGPLVEEPYTPDFQPAALPELVRGVWEERERARQVQLQRNRRALDALLSRGTPLGPNLRLLPPGTRPLTTEARLLELPENGLIETPEGSAAFSMVDYVPAHTMEEALTEIASLPQAYRERRGELQPHAFAGLLGILEGALEGLYERSIALPVEAVEYIGEHGILTTIGQISDGFWDLATNPDQLILAIVALGYESVIGPVRRIVEELNLAWGAFEDQRNVDGGRHIMRAVWELADLLMAVRGAYRAALQVPAMAERAATLRRMTEGSWAQALARLTASRRAVQRWVREWQDRASGSSQAFQDLIRDEVEAFARGLAGPDLAFAHGGPGSASEDLLTRMQRAPDDLDDTARGRSMSARGTRVGVDESIPSQAQTSGVDALIDEDVERAFAPGAPYERGRLRQAGRSREAGRRREFPRFEELENTLDLDDTLPNWREAVRQIMGRRLDQSGFGGAWRGAINSHARAQMREVRRLWRSGTPVNRRRAKVFADSVYGRCRERFWQIVFDDATLADKFRDAGMEFHPGGGGRPPYYSLPDGRREAMSLEHVLQRHADPSRTIDADNLIFALGDENSVHLEAIRRQSRRIGEPQ